MGLYLDIGLIVFVFLPIWVYLLYLLIKATRKTKERDEQMSEKPCTTCADTECGFTDDSSMLRDDLGFKCYVPKTCGNCGRSKPYEIELEPIGSHVLCPDANEVFDSDWSDVCDEWIPRIPSNDVDLGLEERCEQLAKISKRLWNFIAARNKHLEIPQGTYILGKTAEQLSELGVDLDD